MKREIAVDEKNKIIIETDKRYFRPSEVNNLLGDASKARDLLGWEPIISAREMCAEMIQYDLKAIQAKSID